MPVAPSQMSPDIAQAPSPQEGGITALRDLHAPGPNASHLCLHYWPQSFLTR